MFLAHLLYERTWAKKFSPRSRQRSVAMIGILISLICALIVMISQGWLDGLYVLIVSLSFAHVYFHIFNMSESARRIRILTGAYEAQRENRPWEIREDYTPEKMIEERIARLKAMGAIGVKGGKCVSCFHPLLVATLLIERYKKLFN